MSQRTSGNARNRFRKTGSAALRDDDTIGASGQGRADDGAEIVRVFHAVQQNKKCFARWAGGAAGDQIIQIVRLLGGRQGDDTLMLAGAREAIELRAVLEANSDTALPGQGDQFFEAVAVVAAGNHDALERAAGDERFADGVDAN